MLLMESTIKASGEFVSPPVPAPPARPLADSPIRSIPGEGLRILLVDDEPNIRKTLVICLEGEGHQVTAVGSKLAAQSAASSQVFDMAFVDLRLGNDSGLDLISDLLALNPGLKIVVITAFASIDTAVTAIKRGATDYLPKPFTPAQIGLMTRKVAEIRALEQKLFSARDALHQAEPEIEFNSQNPAMRRLLALAKQIASSSATVSISGETGSGKGVLARAIHNWSSRADKPFATVSCPSLPAELLESELFGHKRGAFTGAVRDNPGRVAACEGGTLFLDEIGELPLSLQPKLLRFIQDREYERLGDPATRKADVRVITATNRDLKTAIAEGRFREDLYYRLNVIQIEIPPLRERVEDIPALSAHLLDFFARQNHRKPLALSDAALAALKAHAWPGNVRELRNMLERAAILSSGDVAGVEVLGLNAMHSTHAPVPGEVKLGDPVSLDELEERHIKRILEKAPSLEEASRILGIDQATLWRRRKKYGI